MTLAYNNELQMPKSDPLIKSPMQTPDPAIRRVLPRGSNSLPPEVVMLSQRGRLIEATAYHLDQKGYAATSVQDIIDRAGVSKTTFYKLFKDKEDCYLQCFERISSAHIKVLHHAYANGTDLKARLEDAILAYVQHIPQNAVYANAFFALAPYTTNKILAELNVIKSHYVAGLEYWFNALPAHFKPYPLPTDIFKMLIEGAIAYCRQWIMSGFEQSSTQVHHYICYVIFAGLGLNVWAHQALSQAQKAA